MEFRLLGPLEIVSNSTSLPVTGRKQRAVLALLLLHASEIVRREAVIDALWGADPPDTARQTVAVHVSRLRAFLRQHDSRARVLTRGSGYVLELQGDDLDLQRFEELAEEGRSALRLGDPKRGAELLAGALSLWRGPPLADLGDEPFVPAERRRLEDLRMAALEDRIDADLAAGSAAELVPQLARLALDHPYRERLHEQLMLALYRSGRQREALDVYRETRLRMVEELGIEPGTELQRLQQQILAHDDSLLPARQTRGDDGGPETSRSALRRAAVGIVRKHRLLAAGVAAIVAAGTAVAILTEDTETEAAPVHVVANSLVGLDPGSGKVLSDVPVGDRPVGPALGSGAVWVLNRGDRTVSRVDTRSRRVRTLGGATFAYDVAADSHGNVWVSSSRDPVVTRITTGGGGFPAMPAGPERIRIPFHAGALGVGGGYLWVANAGNVTPPTSSSTVATGKNTVTRVDLRSHRVSAPIRVGLLPYAIAFGYGSAWVADFDSRTLSVIRAGSNRAQRIRLPVGVDDAPLAVAVGAGGVWVVSRTSVVIRIDPDTRRVVARIASRPHSEESFDISVGSRFVWVTNRAANSLSKIDPRTNRIVRTIPLGRVGVVPCGVAATSAVIWVTMGTDTDCASPGTR